MKSILYDKSKAFASRIVKMYKYLRKSGEDVMSKQVLRAGTSIGANLAEAQYGITKAEFAAKISIALKECHETLYWLELLAENGFIKSKQFESVEQDCRELLAMMVASLKTVKKGLS